MRRTPRSVALLARTHWAVGVVIVISIAVLHMITRNLPQIELGPHTYIITGGLAFLYLLTGTLVWFGAPFGRFLSRICGLLYLPRPQFGGRLWDLMNSAEYQAHFEKRKIVEVTTVEKTNQTEEN
jgi:hypothetical protein